MFGAIIGAATAIGGGVVGAIQARKARQKREEELKNREQRQAATYARRANQDYTQRADAQRMLRMTSDILKERQAAAAGRQAVMGVTDSGMAAEREVAEKVLTDTAAELAAAGEAEKQAAEDTYQAQQDENSKERAEIAATTATATGQAVGQAVQGIGQVAGALEGTFAKTPKTTKALTLPNVSEAMKQRINTSTNASTLGAKNLMQEWDKNLQQTLGRNVPGFKV